MAMDLQGYKAYLCAGEKSENTIRKYIRDIENLGRYVGENELTRDAVLGWKQNLRASGYKARSINSMLASANSYFEYICVLISYNTFIQWKRSYILSNLFLWHQLDHGVVMLLSRCWVKSSWSVTRRVMRPSWEQM
jgi:hypothetical protein